MQVDRAGMHRLEGAGPVDGADEPAVVARRCGIPRTSPCAGRCRERGRRARSRRARRLRTHETVAEHELAHAVVEVVAPPPLVVVCRAAPRSAAHARWGSSTNGFDEVDHRRLGRAGEHLGGWAMSHWSSWSRPATSTASERCCRRARHGPPAATSTRWCRGSRRDTGVEPADVDAELERGRGDDAARAGRRTARPRSRAARLAQVAAPVGADAARPGRRRAAPHVGRDHLGALAAAAERDACAHRPRPGQPSARRPRRWSTPGPRCRRSSSGGFHEREQPLAARRAVVGDRGTGSPHSADASAAGLADRSPRRRRTSGDEP